MTLKRMIIGSKGYLARNLLLESSLKFDTFDLDEENFLAAENGHKFYDACEGTESVLYLSHQPRISTEINPEDYLRIAVSRAKAIAEITKKTGVKRLIFSGSYWQEPLGNGFQFLNYYSKSKQLIQEVFEDNASIDFKVISVHLFDIYGPGDDRDKLIPNMLANWRNKQPLVIHSPGNLIVPIHIRDVVHGFKLILDDESHEEPQFKIVSLPGSQVMTVSDLVENFGEVFPDFRFSFFDDGRSSIVQGNSRYLPPNGWRALIDIQEGLSTLKSL